MFIFTFICSLFISKKKEYDEPSPFYRKLLAILTRIAFFVARIHVHADGMDKVPSDTRFLIVGNHISNFDPIITWDVFGLDKVIFITKPENFRYPFFGRLIHRMGYLGIDRDNPRNAVKTINKAAQLMKDDRTSVCIYPEGTRNKSGVGLLPFHHGALKAAQLADVPIVAVLYRDTPKIFKRFPWRGTDVYLDVLEVIPADEVASHKTVDLGNHIRDLMLARQKEIVNI